MTSQTKRLLILGCRGIPAAHGGFETFAERLSLYLAGRGWAVTVACQSERDGLDTWQGVGRLHIRSSVRGPLGTIVFDFRSMLAAIRRRDLVLTLGYNTGLFCLLPRLAGLPNLVNMDGLEWKRSKWSGPVRLWFRVNEWLAARLASHLVADHPAIAAHLAHLVPPRRITTIPYGADRLDDADPAPLAPLGLQPGRYAVVIARPEPENSLLEIVTAFSRRPLGCTLVVLGAFDPRNRYHAAVRSAASTEVMFPGPIYDPAILAALRFHARLYVHGHQVGGTNPSLVEALGAGCPVLAHDNPFNRWVAGPQMRYFATTDACAAAFAALIHADADLASMRRCARERAASFRWPDILEAYERLLAPWSGRKTASAGAAPEETSGITAQW